MYFPAPHRHTADKKQGQPAYTHTLVGPLTCNLHIQHPGPALLYCPAKAQGLLSRVLH